MSRKVPRQVFVKTEDEETVRRIRARRRTKGFGGDLLRDLRGGMMR